LYVPRLQTVLLHAAVAAIALAFPGGCTPRPVPAAFDAGAAGSGADGGACVYPIVARDQRGVDVTVRAPPRRIVSLLPSHTETLFALGVGPAVVGVDDYSADIPGAGALPRLGGLYDARIEPLLALQPDLVLVSETSTAATPLDRGGVATWGGSPARFEDIPHVIEAIGDLVCRGPEAAKLVQRIADDVAAVERAAAGRPPRPVDNPHEPTHYTVGPRSFIGTMIAKAGGEDVVPEALGDFPKISPEAVIAADPAVIFGATPEDVRARPGWEKITAVREGHVYKLEGGQGALVARPGPRIAEGLRILLRRIHPEAAP
jgi:iron complex transport system substrate-binding protein